MNFAPIVAIPAQAAATISSSAIPTSHIFYASAQVVATGSAAGTLKFQASNDNVVSGTGLVPTNWSDITSATVSVSGAGAFLIPKIELCYQWIRVVYTNSGTGTIAANVNIIGP